MKSLKSIVKINMRWLAFIMSLLILFTAVLIQLLATQRQARENAEETFIQLGQIISESEAELEIIKQEYRETCLLNAEVIAYIIRNNPDILGNVEEFRVLAKKLEVDEIHIFDDTGCIFTGTHPEYFNFTFESGEQMAFFKPLLTDKGLRLCQDITPNTAEGKLVQYSALWDAEEKYIVQVGMYPDSILEMTEKNELSYIFSLLKGNPGVSLYAIDEETGEIVGSTSGENNGVNLETLGLSERHIEKYKRGMHSTIAGVDSYCIFEELDNKYIAYVISNDRLYSGMFTYTVMLAFFIILIAAVLVSVVSKFNNIYIINSIYRINDKLRKVAEGNLDERVGSEDSIEFSELAAHINNMIHSLLTITDKMSYILGLTDIPIGVYEFNSIMKSVRFTENVADVLALTRAEVDKMRADKFLLISKIESIRENPVDDTHDIYKLNAKSEKYVRIEQVEKDNEILGVVMDVTSDIANLKRVQNERDIDLLTGLHNRRSMERQFEAIFADNVSMGAGAIIVIDCDNLKYINDAYGHSIGDEYIRKVARIIEDFKAPKSVAARNGGDEFVLLIYGYKNEAEVLDAILRLSEIRDNAEVELADGVICPVRFSFGYEMTRDRRDYDIMLSTADGHMYSSKRERKKIV